MAPMEGLTGYVYRNAYHRYFGGIDRYFTPFLANRGLSHREKQDILLEHNRGMQVIPQILTNQADVFKDLEDLLYDYGYHQVNLNLGCPYGTVTAKGRGAGFLAAPLELERFLDTVFSKTRMQISIKTRIGYLSEEEWPKLVDIFNRFPLTELIVHPRVRADFYENTPKLSAYEYAAEHSRHPLCYNGDIRTAADEERLEKSFPGIQAVMLGRGLLSDPWLVQKIRDPQADTAGAWETFALFHQELVEGYRKEMSEERDVLFRMKELWGYMSKLFDPEAAKKPLRQIKKAKTIAEYEAAVRALTQLGRFSIGK